MINRINYKQILREQIFQFCEQNKIYRLLYGETLLNLLISKDILGYIPIKIRIEPLIMSNLEDKRMAGC